MSMSFFYVYSKHKICVTHGWVGILQHRTRPTTKIFFASQRKQIFGSMVPVRVPEEYGTISSTISPDTTKCSIMNSNEISKYTRIPFWNVYIKFKNSTTIRGIITTNNVYSKINLQICKLNIVQFKIKGIALKYITFSDLGQVGRFLSIKMGCQQHPPSAPPSDHHHNSK